MKTDWNKPICNTILILVLLLAIVPVQPANALSSSWVIALSPRGGIFNSIDMVSASDGWIVGYFGRAGNGIPYGQIILRWDGYTWTDWWSDENYAPLFSVDMVSSSDGWAVGSTILRWNGNNWNFVANPVGGSLKSVDMVSATDGWAVGGGGSCASGSSLSGTIMRWNGNSWSQWSSIPEVNLKSVDMLSASDGWAVGYSCHYAIPSVQNAIILHWNGSNWNSVSSPTNQVLNSVSMLSSSDGWIAGDYGTTLRWNGGSWTKISTPTVCTLNSVSMVSTSDGWAVGGDGFSCDATSSTILHWDGLTWSELTSPHLDPLNDVFMLSAEKGWGVGNLGDIMRYLPPNEQVRVIGVETADFDWNTKTTFNPGDPIRWFIWVENDTGGDAEVTFTYDVKGPNGSSVEYDHFTLTLGPDILWQIYVDGYMPNGVGGTHTFTGSGLYLGTTTQTTTTYTVNPTISGNAGVAGATLNYTDGAPQTATADASGNYSFVVPYGWSGAVTPSQTGYTFSPSSRTYTNVQTDLPNQDYKLASTFASVGTYDGWVLESARGSQRGGSLNASTKTSQLGDDKQNRQYKAILSFDTSKLPAGVVITGAQLRIKQSGLPIGKNPFLTLGKLLVDMKQGSFGKISLELTDFQAPYTRKAIGKFGSPSGGWYTATLPTTTPINRKGVTQFRLYFTKSTDNNNLDNYMKFFSGNSPTNKPQLIITYTLP